MAAEKKEALYTAAKLAEALGVSPGMVKKLLEANGVAPDQIQRGCKYYGAATLKRLQAVAKKS